MSKIHDFRKLGKWSEDTLKANKDRIYNWDGSDYDLRILIIKNSYNDRLNDLCKKLNKLEHKRLWFPKMSSVMFHIEEITKLNNYITSLQADYTKYRVVMSKIKLQEKKKVIKKLNKRKKEK